jgi:hypothetical protein
MLGRLVGAIAIVALLLVSVGTQDRGAVFEAAWAAPQEAANDAATEFVNTAAGVSVPEGPLARAPEESEAVRAARIMQHLRQREALAAREAGAAAAREAATSGPPIDTETPTVSEISLNEDPAGDAASELNAVDRNVRNTVAQSSSSTLAEPAAAKDGSEVFYTGNTYISRSSNSGTTWTAESIPVGPAAAPNICCDFDAVHHRTLDTTFAVGLYLNSNGTRGITRIFVRRATVAGGNDCTYLFDDGVNRVTDYPHIAVSNSFVYVAVNVLDSKGTASSADDTWVASRIRRYNATQMSNCGAVSSNTFSFTPSTGIGQRIFVPVENATTIMYWGANNSSSQFRIFTWPESSTAVTQTLRSLSHASLFVNPDCRGGVGNFDWIERSTAFSIGGFRLRGAVAAGRVWFVWNVADDASHPQAHVHSAIFRESDFALLSTPHIFNATNCVGFPTITANSAGDFALTFALGGDKTANSGTAAQGYICVDDEDTMNNFCAVATRTASGTHNRSDGRFGDYFTARKNDTCPQNFVATNYALLNGNTLSSHVNARYVEFRSSRDAACP